LGNLEGGIIPKSNPKDREKIKITEAQIAFALKQAETGTRVEEICRKFGIAPATFFN
jgi:putative transposase